MSEALRKKLMYIMAAATFVMVAVYEFLTPFFADDLQYGNAASEANNIFDLVLQEYGQYNRHTGRSVSHFILRVLLYTGNKGIFNIIAAASFVLLSYFIYENVSHRKKYDIRIYGMIIIMLWLFDPAISNTVFWETGACNYLIAVTILMGYVTAFRKGVARVKKGSIPYTIIFFLFGIITGWLSENTSGGVILMVIITMLGIYNRNKKLSDLRPWMISGFIGNLIGLALLLLAPGNYKRAAVVNSDEEHTGIMALVARFLKITLNIRDYYFVLVLAFVVILVLIAYRAGSRNDFMKAARSMLLFGLMFVLTDYALIAISSSQLRSYYGASIFLMTGIMCGASWVINEGYKEDLVQAAATSIVSVYAVILLFTYVEQGANLARIKREFNERTAYFEQMAAAGESDIEAPILRPQWDNIFTYAYSADLQEGSEYWINVVYAQYYRFNSVTGVQRKDWDKY